MYKHFSFFDPTGHKHICGFLFFCLACVISSGRIAAQDSHLPAETLQKLVRQWVDLQQEQAEADRAWREREILLEAESEALKRHGELLAKEVEDLESKNALQQKRMAELKAREQALAEHKEKILEFIIEAENQLAGTIAVLPSFLQIQLASELRRLRANSAGERQSAVTERLELILVLFDRIQEANNRFHTAGITLVPPDSEPVQMDVIYAGLARGFAVSPDNRLAAIGTPVVQEGRWDWLWNATLADSIRMAINIYEEQTRARFIHLPMGLDFDRDDILTPVAIPGQLETEKKD